METRLLVAYLLIALMIAAALIALRAWRRSRRRRRSYGYWHIPSPEQPESTEQDPPS